MSHQQQQFAIELACKLIDDTHGKPCGLVLRWMASKGLQTLTEIVRGTGLPESKIKAVLLVMMQHNFASAYLLQSQDEKNARPPCSLYQPHVGRVVQIMR